MPDGQKVHRGIGLGRGAEHQVVAMQVFTQSVGRSGWPRSQLGQGFGRLWRVGQVAPADAREAPQVGNDGGAQLGQQVVEGMAGVDFQQERIDGVQALQEAWGQFNPGEPIGRFLVGLLAWVGAARRR